MSNHTITSTIIGTFRPTTRATRRQMIALDAAHDHALLLAGRTRNF